MKNIRLTIATLALTLAWTGAEAQIRDSTVNIVAYWTPGEKYSYECKTDKYKVNADGDTTWTSRQSEIRTLEVLSQTKDSYTVQISYSDFWSNDPTENEMMCAIRKQCGPMNVLLKTSEMGIPEEILNIPELVKYNEAGLKPMMSVLRKSADMKGIPEKKLIKLLRMKFCSPEVTMNLVNDELGKFLFFHGMALDTAETYTFNDKCAPLIAGQDSLNAMTQFWVDNQLTDEYSAVVRTFTEVPSEDLKKFTASAAASLAGAFAGNKVSDGQLNALKDSLSTGIGNITMTCEEYTTEEIHLDTGWPLKYYYDKVVSVTVPGTGGEEDKTTQNCESRSIEIILPEDDGNE